MKLKNNIYKDYLYIILSRFDLSHGIWVLYLAYKGLNLFEIGLMETVYHVSSFLMEIPTGAVADIYGRKTSRILGRLANTISILLMLYGNTTLAFAISFFFTALGNNLESGAGEALVYDSLKEIKEEHLYIKVRGRQELFFQLAKTASLLLAGYLATKSFEKVYIGALVISILTIVQTFTFEEPTVGRVEHKASILETFVHQLVSSIKVMAGKKQLVVLILALELFSTLYTTVFFYMQTHLKSLGYDTFEIGIILALGALLAAFIATQAHKLEKRFDLKKLIFFSIIVAVGLFWGMTIRGVEKYAFVLISGVEGLLFVVMSDYINKLIPSDKRATILSFQSMIFSMFMIALFPVVGRLGDAYGLSSAFVLVATAASTVLLLLLIIINKRNYTNKV